MFKKVGLITTSDVEAIKTTLIELVGYLRSNDKETILNKNCAELIKPDNSKIFDTKILYISIIKNINYTYIIIFLN